MPELIRLLSVGAALILFPLAAGCTIPLARLSWASRWWTGVMLVGLLVLLGHALNLPQFFVFTSAAVLILWGGIAFFRAAPSLLGKIRRPGNWLPGAMLALFWASTVLYVLTHPLHPLDWDAIHLWFNKAKGLYYWQPFRALPYAGFPMINYPHLGPVLEMLLMKSAGMPADTYARLIFPTAYFFWAAALFELRPQGGSKILAWTLPLIGLVFFDRSAHTSGYQDGFLGAAAGVAAIHFCCFLRAGTPAPRFLEAHLFSGFFFAGALCLIKMEGTVLSLILVGSFLSIYLSAHHTQAIHYLTALRPYLLGWGALVILWPLLLTVHHLDPAKISGPAYSYSKILGWWQHLDRWPVMAPYLMNYLRQNFSILFSSILLSIAAGAMVPESRARLIFLWTILSLHASFVLIAFFATLLPLEWHLETAFARLMFQHFFVYASIITLSAFELISKRAGEKAREASLPESGDNRFSPEAA